MRANQLVGPDAASRKYDVITALGCRALALDLGEQRLALRLVTLLTARYDWRLGALSVGQREIARLWSVDERTVKREMAKLRSLGWLVLVTPARRGRVARYALDLDAVRGATRDVWPRVGGDFAARMAKAQGGAASAGTGVVVPFPGPDEAEDPMDAAAAEASDWARAREILRREEPAMFGNWIEALTREGRAGGRLALRAPSAFHASYVRMHFADRLRAAARRADPEVEEVAVAP